MPQNDRVLVIGIGNPLVRDEGVGVRVVEELIMRFSFPDEVEVHDAGTMGMSILGLLTSAGHVIVVDAVDGTGHPAGTVVLMSPEDLAQNQVMHSLHDVALVDVLNAAELTGRRPSAEIVGIQVKEMESMRLGLTDEVEGAVPDAVRAVLARLALLGHEPSPGPQASPEDVRVLQEVRDQARTV